MRSCSVKECDQTAEWIPKLMMSPNARVWVKGHLDVPHCDHHKERTLTKDLISDDGWAQIMKGFDAVHALRPKRGLTLIEWERI